MALIIKECHKECTVFLMELSAQGRYTDPSTELLVRKPKPCTSRTARTGEVREGMKVEVIDNADKSVNQQPNGCYQDAMSKGWR